MNLRYSGDSVVTCFMIIINMETKKMEGLRENAMRKRREERLDLLNNESIQTANTYRLVLGGEFVDNNDVIKRQNKGRVR